MPIAPTAPSAVPEFPALSDRITYNAQAYAFGTAMRVTFAPEMAALATNVYANTVESAANAAIAVSNAQAAIAASGAAPWVSGANGAVGERKSSLVNGRVYRRLVVGAWTTDPSADATNWSIVSVEAQWVIKTASYTAMAGDAINVNTSAGPMW